MNAEQWTVDGFHPLLLALLVIWLIWQTYVAVQDTRALIRHMWRYRQFPVPGRTPGRPVVRHSSRPTARGPAMASDDDVTRITSSQWPPPGIEPAEAQGFPNPSEPRRSDRRGLIVGMVALLVTVAILGAGAGVYFLWPRSSSTPAAAAQPADTANADGCHEFDKAFKFMHDAMKDPYPMALKLSAEEIMDKVPDAAGLTTGRTKQAMLKTAAAATILGKKEAAFQLSNWSDTDELRELENAWEGVQATCAETGVTLVNAPYSS